MLKTKKDLNMVGSVNSLCYTFEFVSSAEP